MAIRPLSPGGTTVTPPFVQPFLHTLNRMRAQERLRPDQLTERATTLLQERFGPAREAVEAAFAHGSIGLMADHTHYFDGFALLLSLAQGAAVAVRASTSGESRIVTEDATGSVFVGTTADLSQIDDPASRIAAESLRAVIDVEIPVELAVVTNMPPAIGPGRDAAISVATSRAVMALRALAISADDVLMAEVAALEAATGAAFSNAYAQAATVTGDRTFVLIDTATREMIALDVPVAERPSWAVVDVAPAGWKAQYSDARRKEQADEALNVLTRHGFPGLDSFRDLQHRDLEKATAAVPRRLRPLVQYLVTENARVQRMVASVRRQDWQMLGALLLMSHSAKRSDWRCTTDRTDFLVEQAEQMSLEGIYGATQLGESGRTVLISGLPFSVPPFADRIRSAVTERFDIDPEVILL